MWLAVAGDLMTDRVLVEPFAGLVAVSLFALARAKPPASRIGAKSGYAAEIVERVGPIDRVEWSDADASLVAALQAMIEGVDLSPWFGGDARERWREARSLRATDPAAWWIALAGARGGVGGFKGGHVRRSSVDGFIPSRESLARRLDAIASLRLSDRVTITHERADARPYPKGGVVYFDPPYLDAEPYPDAPKEDPDVVVAWRKAASVSSRVLLSERAEVYDLPGKWSRLGRKGQSRRSLTVTDDELLHEWSHPRGADAAATGGQR